VTTEKKKPTSKKGTGKTQRQSKKTEEAPQAAAEPLAPPRLLVTYRDEIAPQLFKEFEYTSSMQNPRLEKIVLNTGIGAEAITNRNAIEAATKDLVAITGQHPVTTKARKSIAGFKIRDGMPMGLKVTLRGRRMYEFFDRFVSSSLPRIRDFRGLSRNAFDGRGNYAVGISEQVIFPEIDYNSIDRMRGLQVIITTTAVSDREGFRLLELMGMPFAHADSDTLAA
jgi:large subunit ribosomal protein L5